MIKVYTSKTCAFCQPVKQFLQYKGVEYTEIDTDVVGRDEIIKLTGRVEVPLVVTPKGFMQGLSYPQLSKII